MKSIYTKITLVFTVLALFYGSCKNPATDVQIVVSTDIFKSPMLIQFTNAKADGAWPKSFEVTLTGPGASLVRTSTGAKVFKVAEGYLNLMLDRAAAPSESNPVKFTLIVNAPGFAPTYRDVEVTSETDPMIIRVPLNEYANPAAATGAVVASQAITNGTSAAALKFITATNAGMNEKTTITIPAGTGFLDAAGQPTGGAKIEARIVHSGTDANRSMTGLSGDGYASNVTDSNGQLISGGVYFAPVASVSITMFAGTKEVKSFTKPLTMDVELNSTEINPATGQPYKENETIPTWSLNTETGQWKQESNATVVKNTNGKLAVQMQITHLSEYLVGLGLGSCSFDVNINLNRPTLWDRTFIITLYHRIEHYVIVPAGATTSSFKMITVDNPRKRIDISVRSRDYTREYDNEDDEAEIIDICGQTIDFNFVEKPDLVNMDVTANIQCTNTRVTTPINSFITLIPIASTGTEDRGRAADYYLKDGRGVGAVENGVTYKIIAVVDGKSYTSQFTMQKTNFEFPAGFGLSGKATYSKSNHLTIDALVQKKCN